MKRRFLQAAITCSIFMMTNSSGLVRAQDDQKEQIAILNVNGAPDSLADTVSNVVDGKVFITTDASTGSIIVRGASKDVEKTRQLLQTIDRKQQVVSFNVTVAVSDTETGKQRIVDEFKLVTVDGQSARSQFGQQVSVPVSRTTSGRSFTQFSTQTVGTLVEVTPKFQNGVVSTELMLEKSWMDAPQEEESQKESPPATFTSSVATTLLLVPGESQSVRTLVGGETSGGRVVVVTVTAMLGSESEVRERVLRSSAQRKTDSAPRREDTRRAEPIRDRGDRGGQRRPEAADRSPERDRVEGSAGRRSGTDRQRQSTRSTGAAGADATGKRVVEAIFASLDGDNDESLNEEERARMPSVMVEIFREQKEPISLDDFSEAFQKLVRKNRER